MKLLTRYILKEITLPLLFGVIAFSFILFGTSVMFSIIRKAIEHNIPFHQLCTILILQMPQVMTMALPMGMLLASLLTFSRLNNDLEIIAIRASGISLIELVKPLLICGIATSCFGIFLSEFIVPKSMTLSQTLIASYQNKNTPTIKKNINFTEYEKGNPKRIINVASVDKGVLRKITIAEFQEGSLNTIIKAKRGKWLKNQGWEFYDGVLHQINTKDLSRLTTIQFETETLNLKTSPFDYKNRKRSVIELTAKELKERIQKKKNLGQDTAEDIMNYHMKFAIAFVSLIYALLGLPIGLKPQRSSSALGIGVTLITICIYYILISIGMAIGQSGILSPILATWLPNIIIGLASVIMLRKLISQ